MKILPTLKGILKLVFNRIGQSNIYIYISYFFNMFQKKKERRRKKNTSLVKKIGGVHILSD